MSVPRIGLDTNVLARYFIDDDDQGTPTTRRQREAARRLIEGGQPLAVAKTVLLELEWVMRGHYALAPSAVLAVMRHLLTLPQLRVEDRAAVERAVSLLADGFDFADALHHASYADCDAVASFDDRRFARRANRRALAPRITLPT